MTNKYHILSAIALATLFTEKTHASNETNESHRERYTSESVERLIQPSSYTYTNRVVTSPDFGSNWFVSVNGGVNAFLGSPEGCGDLGDKLKPQFEIGFGKWFTPTVGTRLSGRVSPINSANKTNQNCWGIGSEILWNLTNALYDRRKESRFNVIPYAGMAVLTNRTTQKTPFAHSYGIIGQYGLTSRLSATLEFGCKTTFSDFDGVGNSTHFGGDNILSLTAGMSYTLGKSGFRRVVDSEPVLLDNERLREMCHSLKNENDDLSCQTEKDARALAELKKIMRIEGLLSRYGHIFRQTSANSGKVKTYPVNDYAGLNSLRARLNGNQTTSRDTLATEPEAWQDDDIMASVIDEIKQMENAAMETESAKPANEAVPSNQTAKSDLTGYLAEIQSGKRSIGSPIYIFFKLGTTELTDPSQSVNLDEIARVAKSHNLKVRVTGSADSHTGTEPTNAELAKHRADTIAAQLQQRGVTASRITKASNRGSDILNPTVANRNCRIELTY